MIGDISTNGDFQKNKFLGKELDRKFGLDWYVRIKGKISRNINWLARPQIKAHIMISDPLNALHKLINMQADGERIYHIKLKKDVLVDGHANKNFTNEQ